MMSSHSSYAFKGHRSPYSMPKFFASHFGLLIWRIFIALFIYTLCRAVFYLYNHDLLAVDSASTLGRLFWGGLRYDVAGLMYVNLLVILLSLWPVRMRERKGYQRLITVFYFAFNLMGLVVNMADVAYYRFTLRRTTLSVLDEFANEDPFAFLYFLVDYWPITLSTLGFIALWILLYRLVGLREPKKSGYGVRRSERMTSWRYYLGHSTLLLVFMTFVVYGIRGFRLVDRAMNINRANVYISQPQQAAMVHNTPYTIIRTLGKPGLVEHVYFDEQKAQSLFSAVRKANPEAPHFGSFKGKNVVVIIWEGLSREWVGSLNPDVDGYQGYTPFLDSLIAHSYCSLKSFSGGTKSIDAMPAILASVPKPMVSFTTSPYASNAINSIVLELEREGYSSAFFHNGTNGSMSFDAMAKQLGFDSYWGRDEYANDAHWDGTWGIWDEEFLQFMVNKIGGFKEPFFVTEFTTSSHSPWKTPQRYDKILPQGKIPQHRSMAYTDLALRRFFEKAKTQSWYDNTLFVIVADHSISGDLDHYKNSVGVFRIPIILHDPSGQLAHLDTETIVQQADLFPTLMALMGIERPIISFGHNIFDPTSAHFAVFGLNDTYQMVLGNHVLQYDGSEVKGLYDLSTDVRMQHNLKDSSPALVAELLPKLQAYIQEFHGRMIHNKLLVSSEH